MCECATFFWSIYRTTNTAAEAEADLLSLPTPSAAASASVSPRWDNPFQEFIFEEIKTIDEDLTDNRLTARAEAKRVYIDVAPLLLLLLRFTLMAAFLFIRLINLSIGLMPRSIYPAVFNQSFRRKLLFSLRIIKTFKLSRDHQSPSSSNTHANE